MITKLCSRCNEIKPSVEFRLDAQMRDGLGSHCRACRNATNREWKARNPEYRQQHIEEERFKRSANYEPIRYSRSVCAHVEQYVSRAIERFQTNTGKEAPPHMTALRDLAAGFVKEHPEEQSRERACPDCGRPLGGRRRVCSVCSTHRQRAIWRAKNDRRRKRVA